MFFKTDDYIELAKKRHIEDQKKINHLERRLTLLLNEKSLAMEVIDRFVDDDILPCAKKWLESKCL